MEKMGKSFKARMTVSRLEEKGGGVVGFKKGWREG